MFTDDFRSYIHNNFGISIVTQLERRDLGEDASFGGKLSDDEELKHQAVIIIHGITNKITRFNGIVQALKNRGYANGEIYGTTWGDAGATPIGLVDMKCSYVKQIRSMIIAVRQYTGTKVDIVAYSMGSPIARKAILGGNCVDSREILGPPLTELIDTFLSVAGSNYGSSLCFVPIPVGTCNKRSGLHCESLFLQDINANTKYEGDFIFSIFSSGDEKVGFRNCNKLVSPIIGQNGYVKKDGLNHDDVMDKTIPLQINFITKHMPQ
uniref:Triacylglycerol lipase n=1 Tax=Acrobeloides nanus TaxID=290746 RepID=A0A914DA27_9BILA